MNYPAHNSYTIIAQYIIIRTNNRLPYRLVFAVMCKESILLYDSQRQRAFAYLDNLQLDSLSQVAWTADGQVLVASSLEGYNSFITIDGGCTGGTPACDPQPAVIAFVASQQVSEYVQ